MYARAYVIFLLVLILGNGLGSPASQLKRRVRNAGYGDIDDFNNNHDDVSNDSSDCDESVENLDNTSDEELIYNPNQRQRYDYHDDGPSYVKTSAAASASSYSKRTNI